MTTNRRLAAAVLLLVAAAATGWRASAGAGDAAAGVRWPDRLTDTGLYRVPAPGAAAFEINPSVRAFTPQYPLWSDGASKRRWIYLPPGTRIDGSTESSWVFPVGTKFWKEFAFDGRRIETRVSWQIAPSRWIFASYAWNADGTDATLAPEGGVYGAAALPGGKQHTIPSRTDCTACHGTANQVPLGFGALQLSVDRDPNAVHAEAVEPDMLTTTSLLLSGQLTGARADLVTRPPRIAASRADTRAVLGYLYGNCAHCHNGKGEIAALAPVLRQADLLDDADAVAASLARPTSWQVPGADRHGSLAVNRDVPELSAILVRMQSRRPSSQMPPLGTVLRDEEAVAMIREWIARR